MKIRSIRRRSLLYRLSRAVVLGVVLGLGGLTACQHKLIYLPAKYPPETVKFFEKSGGTRLEFTTSQGKQTAWFSPAAGGAVPEHVWIVCAGNADLALNYAEIQGEGGFEKDAFVFFDYPGYGGCGGSPNPDRIRESFKALGPMITERAQLPAGALAERGIIFGHSLGAAAGLIAAEEYGIRRAVLISPFTSLMEMTRVVLHAPLGFLVRHRFDNHQTLASLMARGGHAWIFHGDEDRIIPMRMSQELAAESGTGVTFKAVKGAGHNDVLPHGWAEIQSAMEAARK
ncbi:MAG: hypothetical protein V4726_21940 [Verrucomicrobiota bacterium]